MKSALITGITGQDGSYLAELLLTQGYEVHGLIRRLSRPNLGNIENIMDRITTHDGDLLDQSSLNAAVRDAEPDEVYNLASQSFVATSFRQPVLTAEVTGLGVIRMLSAVKEYAPEAHFYQASSSEMFGKAREQPQSEITPFHPVSPYGVAKVLAHQSVVNYREIYNMFASTGISFNHESERRGIEFVTRKISRTVAEICLGLKNELQLGDMTAKRDWSYAPEHMEAAYRILQHDTPDDFVLASGITHSVQDFVETAFEVADLNWAEHVTVNSKYMRPAEIPVLVGDASKAKRELGWEPKVTFEKLVWRMVDHDLRELEDK